MRVNVFVKEIECEHLKEDKILSIFKKKGYDKKKVEVLIEYDKMKSLDINNLKRMRSKYDGLLLGLMPHKMRGDMDGTSLIAIIEQQSEESPPLIVLRDETSRLKISNNSLKKGLEALTAKMERVNTYEQEI